MYAIQRKDEAGPTLIRVVESKIQAEAFVMFESCLELAKEEKLLGRILTTVSDLLKEDSNDPVAIELMTTAIMMVPKEIRERFFFTQL